MPTSSNVRTSQQQPENADQQGNQNNQKKSSERTMTLSEAASIMRNSNASPEDRSLAASIMGREGGKHSHDHDEKRRKAAGE